MDLKNTANAAMLLYESMIKGKTDFAKIPFKAQKTALLSDDPSHAFRRSSPERQGLDGKKVLALLKALSTTPETNIHSVLLLANGKEIFSASAEGYHVRTPHAAFSFSKTVTGIAIGMLIEEGKLSLDDRVHRFFPEYRPVFLSRRTRLLTVKHLLTMSSGVVFAETGAAVETNWIKSFFESAVRFSPGTEFAYNSMNSYMLSAIVTRVAGCSLTDYLTPRLFSPLGIENFFWEKCPLGIEKGGWGLYLSAESMAKIGQLLLDGGVYRGVRLISEAWVKEACSVQTRVPASLGSPYHYGYHLWVHEDGSFLLNGMFGQNTLVSPASRTVLTLTSGDACVFQDALSLNIASSFLPHLCRKKRLFASPFLKARLRRAEKNFGKRYAYLSPHPLPHEKEREGYLSEQGIFERHHASANNTGILPFLVRLLQNNHSNGLSYVTLQKTGENTLSLCFDEGKESYIVPLGAHRYQESSLCVFGELYRVRGAYEWGYDEHRAPALKISLVFPELASARHILFRMKNGSLTLSLSETPGFDFVERLLRSAKDGLIDAGGILAFLLEKIKFEQIIFRMNAVFSPELRLSSPREKEDDAISNTLFPLIDGGEEEIITFLPLEDAESTAPKGFFRKLFIASRKETKK